MYLYLYYTICFQEYIIKKFYIVDNIPITTTLSLFMYKTLAIKITILKFTHDQQEYIILRHYTEYLYTNIPNNIKT